jgi:hypothetical protein
MAQRRRNKRRGAQAQNRDVSATPDRYQKFLPEWMRGNGSTPVRPPRPPRPRRPRQQRTPGGYTPGKFATGDALLDI